MKPLYYFLSTFSVIGICFLIKKNARIGIMVLTIIIFGLIGRNLYYASASRYYSIFILVAVFLSAYAIDTFFSLLNHRFTTLLFIILLPLSLSIHLIKCFSGFRNNYILDLRDNVEAISRRESNSFVFISAKEFRRIGQAALYNRIYILPSNQHHDFANLSIEKSNFYNSSYFIEPGDATATTNSSTLFQNAPLGNYLMIENHFSNSGHTKCVSVYRYSSYIPSPDCDLSDHYANPILRAFIPEYDTYIYQVQNKMVWLIGKEIDPKTEIIFHLFTNKPHLLPERRRKYGFDNRGFRGNNKYERESIGKYRVFEKDIPSEYPVISIQVGFNFYGTCILRKVLLDQ